VKKNFNTSVISWVFDVTFFLNTGNNVPIFSKSGIWQKWKQRLMSCLKCTAIKQLNTNKAHDYFGLTAENFIHASNQLIEHLKQLINLCFHFCHINSSDIWPFHLIYDFAFWYKFCNNKIDYFEIPIWSNLLIRFAWTYSKIIEKIIKEREKSKILLSQNPLQKGFTENSIPLCVDEIFCS
jgi:superfamily I DNA and/or RNA helicase